MAEGLAGAMRKSGAAFKGGLRSPAMTLYRNICKEIPRILTIYDIDMKVPEVSPVEILLLGKECGFCV